MNKKHTFKKTAALLLGIALSVGATGCGFITTDNQADLEQVVATVDITEHLKTSEKSEYKDVADEVEELIGFLSKDIYKRDLISSYLSTGYTYVESYGYTYEQTFNLLLDNLVNREIMIQYAVAYYIKNGAEQGITVAACKAYIENALNDATGKQKELLENHKEVLALKYFLTDGGKTDEESMKDYNSAVYSLKQSLNSSLDSLEASYISAESEEHVHPEARTMPTGVDTLKEDYIPAEYEIYTGRNALSACGEYKAVDGSTTASRQKAYNAFLTNIQAYNLINIDEEKGEVEDTADITQLNYYYVELSSILGQSLINKYFESLEDEISSMLTDTYMVEKYNAYKAQNEQEYANDPTAFSTALDSASADSFMLYGLENFGYVYNILIPFDAIQTVEYTQAQNMGLTQDQLYAARRDILDDITGKDLRDSWISPDDHVDYSYEKEGKIYFFEDNFKEETSYEKLTQYAGNYPFNGTLEKDENGKYVVEDDSYVAKATPVTINDFIGIFEGYIAETASVTTTTVSSAVNNPTHPYYATTNYKNAKGEVEYENFVYYEGKVNFTEMQTGAGFFDPETQQYKALSAVNELMFAYSTDTGCLNTYMGYSVSPYGTNFVKEFEYAAQQVVKNGVGSYMVCATDYGWHIVYCSFSYKSGYTGTDGDVYGGYVHADKDTEGSFSNLFYESIKESAYTNYATEEQNKVLIEYNNESTVKRFQKTYQDLLDMDS